MMKLHYTKNLQEPFLVSTQQPPVIRLWGRLPAPTQFSSYPSPEATFLDHYL